jgi:hypothetical protein
MKMIKLICITLLIPCLGISQMINKINAKSKTEIVERVFVAPSAQVKTYFPPADNWERKTPTYKKSLNIVAHI